MKQLLKKQNKEELEQKKCVEYMRILEARNKIITFFAPMNENLMSNSNREKAIRIENKAKKMGKRSGVSDLVVVLRDKVLFIELKRAGRKLKNGKISYAGIKVSENQKAFLNKIEESEICNGFIAYGFNDFKDKIDKILKGQK